MIRTWMISAAVIACALGGEPAFSRFVVIDANSNVPFTPCTYGASSCQAFSTTMAAGSHNSPAASGTGAINFSLNYGNGLQSDVYVYDNGLISIGGQPSGVGNPFATPGLDVLSPAFGGSSSVVAGSFSYSTGNDGSGLFGSAQPQFLRLNYTVQSNNDPSTQTPVQASFFQVGNPGDFVLFFAYGTFATPPTLADNTLIGFSLGSNEFRTTAGQNQAALADTNDSTTFRYTFVGGRLAGSGTGAVPEPNTWMLLILGFGAIGFAMRRRTARSPAYLG